MEISPPRRRGVASRAIDLLAVLVIIVAIYRVAVAPHILGSSTASAAAPQVRLATLDGRGFDLAQARGRTVFLDFWATWCGPCTASIPLVQHFERTHPQVVVVSVDAGETPQLAGAFARARAMRGVAFDPDLTAAHAYGVDGFPTMVVIDPRGKVRATWVGFNPLIEQAMGDAAHRFGGEQAPPAR